MTRNRELDLEDLREHEHHSETMIVDDSGNVSRWLCHCGAEAPEPAPQKPTPSCKVGMVHYRDKLRPRDELVRLAWLAHDGRLCLASKGRLGQYVDNVLWGPGCDTDDRPKGSDERLSRACELFASGAMSLAAQLGADVARGAVVDKVVTFEWRRGRYRAVRAQSRAKEE